MEGQGISGPSVASLNASCRQQRLRGFGSAPAPWLPLCLPVRVWASFRVALERVWRPCQALHGGEGGGPSWQVAFAVGRQALARAVCPFDPLELIGAPGRQQQVQGSGALPLAAAWRGAASSVARREAAGLMRAAQSFTCDAGDKTRRQRPDLPPKPKVTGPPAASHRRQLATRHPSVGGPGQPLPAAPDWGLACFWQL